MWESASRCAEPVREENPRRRYPLAIPSKSQYPVPCEPSRSPPDECRLGKQHPKESTEWLPSPAPPQLLQNFTDLIALGGFDSYNFDYICVSLCGVNPRTPPQKSTPIFIILSFAVSV